MDEHRSLGCTYLILVAFLVVLYAILEGAVYWAQLVFDHFGRCILGSSHNAEQVIRLSSWPFFWQHSTPSNNKYFNMETQVFGCTYAVLLCFLLVVYAIFQVWLTAKNALIHQPCCQKLREKFLKVPKARPIVPQGWDPGIRWRSFASLLVGPKTSHPLVSTSSSTPYERVRF